MDDTTIFIERPPRDDARDGNLNRSDDAADVSHERTAAVPNRSYRWFGLAVLLLAVAAIALLTRGADPQPPPEVVDTQPVVTEPPPALSVAVFDTIIPSIVTVRTGSGDGGFGDDGGLGTGVVINEQGLILTSLHVVDGASVIELVFADGTVTEAGLTGADPANDIAVLAPSSLPGLLVPAVLGNPGALRVGDEAFVVGHPLGLTASMSAGVISGFERTFESPDTGTVIDGLIQFDASVNPGNSGGPLLNRRGEVVGIVAALANPSGDDSFSGIGFAVTIEAAGGGLGPGQ